VTYEDLLDHIITDGIAEVREAYAAPENHHKRDGAIEGFEACRGKNPAELVESWKTAEDEATKIMRDDRDAKTDAKNYWNRRYKAPNRVGFERDLGRAREQRASSAARALTDCTRCHEVRRDRRRTRRSVIVKLVIYQHGERPIEIEADRVRVFCGQDHYELREQTAHGRDGSSLLVRLEEHDGGLALDLAVFPSGGNAVRLKGGLR